MINERIKELEKGCNKTFNPNNIGSQSCGDYDMMLEETLYCIECNAQLKTLKEFKKEIENRIKFIDNKFKATKIKDLRDHYVKQELKSLLGEK